MSGHPNTFMTHLIVILGILTIALSMIVANKFLQHSKNSKGTSSKLSRSLTGQLVGEAIIGLGTLAFAVLAHLGHLQHIPIEFQSMMRLTMFLATSATTIHLWVTVRRIER